MARNDRYPGLGLGGLISYRGDPEMFLNVTMVTFFDMEDQRTLRKQRGIAKVFCYLPLVVGLIAVGSGLYGAVVAGTLAGMEGQLVTAAIVIGVAWLLGLGLSWYVCRGWFAFKRWARKYDAHIVSMLMGGRRDRLELPKYTELVRKIRGER